MTLPDKHSTLRDVLTVFAESGEKPWTLLLSEVQAKLNARAEVADLAKAKKAELRIKLDALGSECSKAIAALKAERCNQLTEDEVCAYCRRGLKLMRPLLADFREERKGPPRIGHVPLEESGTLSPTNSNRSRRGGISTPKRRTRTIKPVQTFVGTVKQVCANDCGHLN